MLFCALPPPYLIIDLDYYFFLSKINLVQDMLTIIRIGGLGGELALFYAYVPIFIILNSCICLLISDVEVKMLLLL